MNLLYRICSRHEILLKLALSTNQSIMHIPSSGVWICHVNDKNNPFSNLQRFFSVCDYHLVWFMRVPLVEQELPTLPEHLSSPPVLSGVRVTRSLVLYVCFVDLVCPFVLFLWTIVLSVLHRLMADSDYLYCIFKLFVHTMETGSHQYHDNSGLCVFM